MRKEILEDVPRDMAGEIVKGFLSDDSFKIELVRKFNGQWDITAYFPKSSVSE